MTRPDAITAQELAILLNGTGELCLIDVREQGVYARGHLFFARSVPLSVLELRMDALVPRRATEIVLCDDGGGSEANDALKASARRALEAMGYTSIRTLSGTRPDWEAAGLGLFEGIHVPSKAFGEHVEHMFGTPSISPEELADLIAGGDRPHVFDCRPLGEFRHMSLPGGLNCPGGELVRRLSALAARPDETIVVNCAGRTRSIIGTQTLINAGFPNKVVALRNGTMGWELAGFTVDRGADAQVPVPADAALDDARALARDWAGREGLTEISWPDYQRMAGEAERTTYLFDVRDPQEVALGTLRGAVSAPAGQLVQTTDIYAGVLRARLVLYDPDGIRNVMAASWLRRAGWDEVFLLTEAPAPAVAVPVSGDDVLGLVPESNRLSAQTFKDRRADLPGTIIDLSKSAAFHIAHPPGAWFGIRSCLHDDLVAAGIEGGLILTARDPATACRAYKDLAGRWPGALYVLIAPFGTWEETFGPLESGFDRALCPPEDMWHTPSSPLGGGKPAMAEYISWEVGLLERAGREPGVRYNDDPAALVTKHV